MKNLTMLVLACYFLLQRSVETFPIIFRNNLHVLNGQNSPGAQNNLRVIPIMVTSLEQIEDLKKFGLKNRVYLVQNSRGIWSFIGDWIQGVSWLPIEFNIPDAFGAIGNTITGVTQNILQRIPFIGHHFQQNNTPRPIFGFVGKPAAPSTAEKSEDILRDVVIASNLPYP